MISQLRMLSPLSLARSNCDAERRMDSKSRESSPTRRVERSRIADARSGELSLFPFGISFAIQN